MTQETIAMRESKATDQVMPSAQDTVRHNPMTPSEDSPKTAREAVRVFWQHISPRILLVAAVAMLVWRLGEAPLGWRDLALGVAIWAIFPFAEWFIHKYMLHFRPRQVLGLTIDFYLPKTHRRHHAQPWNLYWVFIPRHIHVMVLAAMIAVSWVTEAHRADVLTCFTVILILGLHYEWVHYLGHITWRPRLAYYERRVLEHRYHHFRNENYWWGVSRGLGDVLLRTAPPAKDIGRSGTTTDLGIKR
jgi:hypothetical protein